MPPSWPRPQCQKTAVCVVCCAFCNARCHPCNVFTTGYPCVSLLCTLQCASRSSSCKHSRMRVCVAHESVQYRDAALLYQAVFTAQAPVFPHSLVGCLQPHKLLNALFGKMRVGRRGWHIAPFFLCLMEVAMQQSAVLRALSSPIAGNPSILSYWQSHYTTNPEPKPIPYKPEARSHEEPLRQHKTLNNPQTSKQKTRETENPQQPRKPSTPPSP